MSFSDNTYRPYILSDGRRWTAAPLPTTPFGLTTGTITGVYLAPDEEVEWHTAIAPDGSTQVTGYTINKKRQTP